MNTSDRIRRHHNLDEERRELQALVDIRTPEAERLGISGDVIARAGNRLAEIHEEQRRLLSGRVA